MESTVHLHIIDDDDDFDWEEACKVIDVVCDKANKQSTFASTSTCNSAIAFQNPNSNLGFCPKTEKNKPRQSTLDRFVGLRPAANNKEVRYDVPQLHHDFSNDERVTIDPEAAKTWVYPENVPVRDYQVSITETALFSNTLVSLPTGLGKTLIAAVVMYNYFRWFPQGKIVFAAPSRPLVMQQIEACHNIVGIPQEYTVDMTGQTSPSKRVRLWKEKRVFFLTPQVLEKDIQSGSCLVKQIVCLVIDEAHRASGNYSYCVAVRELMAVPVQFRILALSATPGSNHQTIQQVIDNLQISSLEHRNESDPDVAPYVHDRKIELIRVEMGKDAVDVHNLLMDVMRPYIIKLSDFGVLPKRNVEGFSPVDFLNSRLKFRDFMPQDLAHKSSEIEGTFGILLTLHHIRKLLSAHGIRPAFEMLEEKLKQRFFSCFMSNNEVLHKAKLMMQQHLSHGAYSPKFVKMLEVLVEHFNTQDPQKSRVIIFSNFRDSVRDIMSSLATIGEHVKATEFIGQNSGKTSKGQTQKVQQAVLEKFRAGGYNVIVATSIGEEGLDIMEVDLVISFDANISPLRMIQRMGRTGRKSKGRVVVLACEGSEINGYLGKQKCSKNINKHLVNGEQSFNFHLSPRMVPHVFKPEKKLETLYIEDYVRRGKKVKEDDAIQTPKYKLKLTDVETDLLAKYFEPSSENNWRPSLISFPHFQAFPSSVLEVGHSFRTTMLIDTMQYLQGLSFDGPDEETLEERFKVEISEYHNVTIKEDTTLSKDCRWVDAFCIGWVAGYGIPVVSRITNLSSGIRHIEDDLIHKEPEKEMLSPMDISRTEEKNDLPPIHSFLFGSDFMSVDLLGKVLILSVPSFPLNQVSSPKSSSPQNTLLPNCLEPDSSHLNASHKKYPEVVLDVNDAIHTEISNLEISNREFDNTHSGDELIMDCKADDLSPRLTNLLMSGVVPESPIDNGTSCKGKGYCTVPDLDMFPDTSRFSIQTMNVEGVKESTPDRRNVVASCMQAEIQTPEIGLLNSSSEKGPSVSMFVGEIRTPLTNLSNKSCSKDWILSSGEKSVSQPKRKLKRLRKYGDMKSGNLLDKEEIVGHSSVSCRSRVKLAHASDIHGRGDRKLLNDARVFIDAEAEASSEASDNEEVDDEQDSYGGSFIDDRINPTMASTQAETSQFDMMAVYRRSLLTQSPIVDFSPDNMVSIDQTHDSGSGSGSVAAATTPSLHTNNNGDSSSVHLNTTHSSSCAVIPLTTDGSYKTKETKKRKLSLSQGDGCGSLPIRNLETEMFSNPEAAAGKEQEPEQEPTPWQMDEFVDDDFYQGIDLDALEAQAAEQLRSKSQLSNEKPKYQDLEFLDSPSFDLGI